MCVLVKKLRRGHAGLVEAGDVGRLIRIRLQDEIETGGDVGLLENLRPHGARARGLHGELVVHHAADHVEVQIRRELRGRHRWLVDEGVRADESDLLRRPEREQHVAAARLLRKRFGDSEHRGRARRIVVRAVVNLAGFFLAGERVAVVAAAEMVVVRAQRNPRLDRRP